MRAICHWHIENTPGAFGDYRVVNQHGGFEGQHRTLADAEEAGRRYVSDYPGDTFQEVTD